MIILIFFLSANIFSFNIAKAFWTGRTATVMFTDSMEPTNAQQLKEDLDSNGTLDWIDESKKGFNRWLAVNGVDFNISYSDDNCGSSCALNNGRNEIYWINPDDFTYEYPDRALGITFRYKSESKWLESDIVINKKFDIDLIPGEQDDAHRGFCILGSNLGAGAPYTGCYDFSSIITHEIGHFFGLEHSSENPDIANTDTRKQQTMYYSIDVTQTLLPLHNDDIDGIYCLYPYGEKSLNVEECCDNQNPLLRPSICSHSFSDETNKSLVSRDGGGCGTISNKEINKNQNKLFFILVFLPIFVLFIRKQTRC